MPLLVVDDAREAKMRLTELELRIKDLAPMWPRVGRALSTVVAKQFQTKGAYLGTPWKPLNPDYAAWKVANGFPRDILIRTGVMRRSFVARPMYIERYGDSSAQFGSDEFKVKFHQFGTRYLAKRPMIKVTPRVRDQVKDVMADYLLGNLP